MLCMGPRARLLGPEQCQKVRAPAADFENRMIQNQRSKNVNGHLEKEKVHPTTKPKVNSLLLIQFNTCCSVHFLQLSMDIL